MDSRRSMSMCVCMVVLIISFISIHALPTSSSSSPSPSTSTSTSTSTSSSSVVFIDSHTHPYFRPISQQLQSYSMSVMEVGAAVSVLLGLAPPPMLSTSSSSKLNELLMPNPFDRPCHVFMLEVALAEDSEDMTYPIGAFSGHAIKRKVISSSSGAQIELPDSEEVTFSSFGGQDYDSLKSVADKDLSDFAQYFGGSYISDNFEALNGELIIPLSSGLKMNLHMSKKADREFATSLVYMIDNVRKVMGMTQDFSGSRSNVAELLGGYFNGIQVLQEEYGSKDVVQQAIDVLLTSVSKIFDSLHNKHEGQVVAVILFSKVHFSQPKKILDVTFDSRPSSRWLEEVKTTSNSTTESEVALVRTTLAWISGIVLLIATIIGVYLLVNMPLTSDTLLYSNVKLD